MQDFPQNTSKNNLFGQRIRSLKKAVKVLYRSCRKVRERAFVSECAVSGTLNSNPMSTSVGYQPGGLPLGNFHKVKQETLTIYKTFIDTKGHPPYSFFKILGINLILFLIRKGLRAIYAPKHLALCINMKFSKSIKLALFLVSKPKPKKGNKKIKGQKILSGLIVLGHMLST